MSRLIGLSLSSCISAVVNGTVKEDYIEKIIAGTCVKNPDDMDKVMETYRSLYWSADPDLGEEIARRLFDEGKIEQPKLNGEQHPGISNGIWKMRRFSFHFSDGDVFYAEDIDQDRAYSQIEGVLDDKPEEVECMDEMEIEEGTAEWEEFEESFPIVPQLSNSSA